MLKRAPTLISSDIVVRVARTTMEGASGQPDAGREFVQFLNTIRNEMEPRITVLLDLGIVNVYHLNFSLPGWNLPLAHMCARVVFQGSDSGRRVVRFCDRFSPVCNC